MLFQGISRTVRHHVQIQMEERGQVSSAAVQSCACETRQPWHESTAFSHRHFNSRHKDTFPSMKRTAACAYSSPNGRGGSGAPLSGSFSCLWPPFKGPIKKSVGFYQRFHRQTCPLELVYLPLPKMVFAVCFNYETCLTDNCLCTLKAVCFGPRCVQAPLAFRIRLRAQDQRA